jgi:hypothetical protein
MRQWNFKWTLGILFVGVTALFIIYHGKENVVNNDISYLIAPFTAVVAGCIALCHFGWEGKRALVVRDMLIGSTLWFFGEVVLLILAWRGMDASPSLADLLFFIGYFFFGRAVILEADLFEVQWKKLNFHVLAFLVTAFAALAGVVGYIGAKGYDGDASMLTNVAILSWSVGDLIVGGLSLVLLVMVWEYRDGTVRREWIWFMGAMLTHLIADTAYSLSPAVIVDGSWTNTLLNIAWMGGYFCIAGYFLEMDAELRRVRMKISREE